MSILIFNLSGWIGSAKPVGASVLASVCLAAAAHAGNTQAGDITAAVRDAGLTTSIAVNPSAAIDGTPERLVDGRVIQRYLNSSVSGPLEFTLSLPDGFLPGEDIVLTGITFCVTNTYYNAARMPKSWVVEGSNDGGSTWETIASVSGFTDYPQSGSVCGGTCPLANWKSYRAYRITVTEATGTSSYFLQLSEIMLHGLYGGTVVQPAPELIDVSKSVRDAGKQTCRSNAGMAADYTSVARAYNGVWTADEDRYLSNAATTKSLLDNGQSINIDYCIGGTYCCGADIVVTAYTIDADYTVYASRTLPRLPKSWQLQGSNDGEAWTTLDTVRGFNAWEKRALDEHEHYYYTFKFVNSSSYRQYRLSVSELNDRSSAGDMVQISEMQLFGYVDAGIAGRVGTSMSGMAIDIAAHESTGTYAPSIVISEHETGIGTDNGSGAELFDGNYSTEFLVRLGVDSDELCNAPLTFGYEFPDAYLEGKELVLKQYTMCSLTTAGQYQNRMPATWSLEGFIGDRWVRLDRKTGFDGWETGDNNLYFKTFSLPDNHLSCRRYRFLVYDSHGTSTYDTHTSMHQIRLCEIKLEGEWGTGISEPYKPSGFIVAIW